MKKRTQEKFNLADFIRRRYHVFLLISFFIVFLILRFYQMEIYNPFGWDQTDNAWAAKKILVDHQFPLSGMVAKGNTGFHIGPLYYYMVAAMYWLTGLDPIASGIFAGITAIIAFFVIYFIVKDLFSRWVAFIAVLIHTISSTGIVFDRLQWPVNFVPIIGLAVFYCLYKIVTGNEKYILLLAGLVGFAFHIHFTAVFLPIIILLAVPFLPRTKKIIINSLFGILIITIFFIPSIVSDIQTNRSNSSNMTAYVSSSYHGFHLTRVMQLAGDAVIHFEPYLFFPEIKNLKFILLPLFIFFYCYKKLSRNKVVFCYIMLLFFLVPWLVLSTYKGELSEYYFSINRFFVVMVSAYLLYRLFLLKHLIPKIFVVSFVIVYGYMNITSFFSHAINGLVERRLEVKKVIEGGNKIEFAEGVPQSYIYDLEMGKFK